MKVRSSGNIATTPAGGAVTGAKRFFTFSIANSFRMAECIA